MNNNSSSFHHIKTHHLLYKYILGSFSLSSCLVLSVFVKVYDINNGFEWFKFLDYCDILIIIFTNHESLE